MDFSQKIALLRNERNLTQKTLGENLNINRSTIAGYEAENKETDFNTLILFAKFFDVSTDYLLGHSDIKKPYTDPEHKELLVLFDKLSPANKKKVIEMIRLLFDSKEV